MNSKLIELYRDYCSTISDINEHLYLLKSLAEQCNHVTEFGTREGISTVTLLAGQPSIFVTIDKDDCSGVVKRLSRISGDTELRFIQGDVLNIQIGETDFLFIDTYHTYYQLSTELKLHADSVRKYIAIHDIEEFGIVGTAGCGGMKLALYEFLVAKYKEWGIIDYRVNNNGLIVLGRYD
tara:strand:- start:101 stop:640 length:540 start_codon:yes stop_codon:yes gene_type:complete